jgi:hypothetical protein
MSCYLSTQITDSANPKYQGKRSEIMSSIGICFFQPNLKQIGYETYQLFLEAEKHYDCIIPINNPRSISYQFIEGYTKPKILLDGQDISNLDTLLFRQGGKRRLPSVF